MKRHEIIKMLEEFEMITVNGDVGILPKQYNALAYEIEKLTLTDVGFSETELPNIDSKEFKIWYEANGYETTSFNNIISKNGLDYPLENVYKHYTNLLEFGN